MHRPNAVATRRTATHAALGLKWCVLAMVREADHSAVPSFVYACTTCLRSRRCLPVQCAQLHDLAAGVHVHGTPLLLPTAAALGSTTSDVGNLNIRPPCRCLQAREQSCNAMTTTSAFSPRCPPCWRPRARAARCAAAAQRAAPCSAAAATHSAHCQGQFDLDCPTARQHIAIPAASVSCVYIMTNTEQLANNVIIC